MKGYRITKRKDQVHTIDQKGNIVEILHENGSHTRFSFYNNNRKRSKLSSDGKLTTYTYSSAQRTCIKKDYIDNTLQNIRLFKYRKNTICKYITFSDNYKIFIFFILDFNGRIIFKGSLNDIGYIKISTWTYDDENETAICDGKPTKYIYLDNRRRIIIERTVSGIRYKFFHDDYRNISGVYKNNNPKYSVINYTRYINPFYGKLK